MFLDWTRGSSKGQDVLKVFQKLSQTRVMELYQEEEVPRTEASGASQSPSIVLWELFQRRLGKARIRVLLPQEHLILTHELQNVWDCCASILQNCYCDF